MCVIRVGDAHIIMVELQKVVGSLHPPQHLLRRGRQQDQSFPAGKHHVIKCMGRGKLDHDCGSALSSDSARIEVSAKFVVIVVGFVILSKDMSEFILDNSAVGVLGREASSELRQGRAVNLCRSVIVIYIVMGRG